MEKKTLTNSKMGRLVARLLGVPELSAKDGKVILSDEERKVILSEYGQGFLDSLEAADIRDDSAEAVELFNAAVVAKTSEATAALKEQIARLQEDVAVLAAEPEPKPAPKFDEAKKEAGRFVVNMAARHNKVVADALKAANPASFAALADATIDVADLNAEFSMVMPPRQRLELLTKRLYLGFDDSRHMTRVQSNTDYIASAAIMSEVSQQFTPKWTPKGTAKFTPIRIPYRRHKINVLIQPTEILKSWLLYLYEQGKTQAEMPVTKYIIETHIVPKVLEDITLSMIGKGKFVEVAAGVQTGDAGSAAKDSMDGYETILVEGLSDADCKFNYYKNAVDYTTFAKDPQGLLDYVDGFVDAISGLFAKVVTVFCSEQFLTAYKRADYAVNGKYTGEETDGSIRFTNFHLTPLQSMYNSKILFATPKENFVELVDYSKADRCINKIEEVDYEVKVFGEYSLSVGFKIQEAVFAAVPEGYDPAATIMSDTLNVGTADSPWKNGAAASSDAGGTVEGA